jgi:hypothetical protein
MARAYAPDTEPGAYEDPEEPLAYGARQAAFGYNGADEAVPYDGWQDPRDVDHAGGPAGYDQGGEPLDYGGPETPFSYVAPQEPPGYVPPHDVPAYADMGEPSAYDGPGTPLSYDGSGAPLAYGPAEPTAYRETEPAYGPAEPTAYRETEPAYGPAEQSAAYNGVGQSAVNGSAGEPAAYYGSQRESGDPRDDDGAGEADPYATAGKPSTSASTEPLGGGTPASVDGYDDADSGSGHSASEEKLEQIKDLYMTVEAIGDDNVDKHFDELLQRQRELISEYFKETGIGTGKTGVMRNENAAEAT